MPGVLLESDNGVSQYLCCRSGLRPCQFSALAVIRPGGWPPVYDNGTYRPQPVILAIRKVQWANDTRSDTAV